MIDVFLSFENEHNLLGKEVDGFHYWAYLRWEIYKELLRIKTGSLTLRSKEKPTIKDCLNALVNCTFRHPLIRAKQHDVLFVIHPRRVWNGESFECIYTDELAKSLGDLSTSIEIMYDGNHLRPPSTANLLYLDYITVIHTVLSKLFKKLYRKKHIELIKISEYLDSMIGENFGISIGCEFISKLMVSKYIYFAHIKKSIAHLLKKIQPKVILEVVGYGPKQQIINEAASALNIPTIELQHGVINQGNVAYNYLKTGDYPLFPDKIFLFGTYWMNSRFPIAKDCLAATGFPYHERLALKYPKINSDRKALRILVLSQPHIKSELLAMVIELLELLELKGIEYKLIYKPHPVEYLNEAEQCGILTKFDSVTIAQSGYPLYKCFSESDIQIGVSSAAMYEGLAYNLKTFVYQLEIAEMYMDDLAKRRYARYFKNADELAGMIEDRDYFEDINANEFFAPNSLDNILKEINKYL